MATTEELHEKYEPNPDPKISTRNVSTDKDIDYEPQPSRSLNVSPAHDAIIKSICSLYSGSASESDMRVYSPKAIYDDPWSYCDTRYKIAGQWYGIPKIFATSRTLKTEVVKDEEAPGEIVFKLQQEYNPKLLGKLGGKMTVNSLVSLTLEKEKDEKTGETEEKVKYHKDMWNEKDYSHGGIGKFMKEVNGDYLTGVTRPPKDL